MISIPWTGVKDNDVEVPDLASADNDFPSNCVRSLLALDNLAGKGLAQAISGVDE